MNKTEQYSPGLHKLIYHTEHIRAIVDSTTVGPMHVSVWPTTKCQCACKFCSFKATDLKGEKMELDSVSLLKALLVLKRYGLLAVEFSGGGEPTLWSEFSTTIPKVKDLGLSLSLITNGHELRRIGKDVLSCFNWVRVSVHSLDHIRKIQAECPIPFSCSYIVGPETSIDDLCCIMHFCDSNLITLRVGIQQPASERFTHYVRSIVKEPAFFTYKPFGSPKGCYMAWVRAGIDWRGNFIVCPGKQLTRESTGYIPEDFSLCHIRDLEKWLLQNTPRDLGYRCSICSCGKEINDYLHCLKTETYPKDSEFV